MTGMGGEGVGKIEDLSDECEREIERDSQPGIIRGHWTARCTTRFDIRNPIPREGKRATLYLALAPKILCPVPFIVRLRT